MHNPYYSTLNRQQNCALQASEELRLPVELAAVEDALQEAYEGVPWQGTPQLALELRASLSCAASWAPMVRPGCDT